MKATQGLVTHIVDAPFAHAPTSTLCGLRRNSRPAVTRDNMATLESDMRFCQRCHAIAQPTRVTATYENESHWHSYYFTVGKTGYFLPHTPEEPSWELLEEIRDSTDEESLEYRTVAKGPKAVTAFLVTHHVEGILRNGVLPAYEEEA